jgi:hypothetical protein
MSDFYTDSVLRSEIVFGRVRAGDGTPVATRARIVKIGSDVIAAAAMSALSLGLCSHPTLGTSMASDCSAAVINPRVFAQPRAEWVSEAYARLERYRTYEANWEPGAIAISPRAIEALKQLLNLHTGPHTPIPSIVPLVDGGVQAEWHRGGVDLEIRASAEGTLTAVASGEGDVGLEEPVDLDPSKRGWIEDLITG